MNPLDRLPGQQSIRLVTAPTRDCPCSHENPGTLKPASILTFAVTMTQTPSTNQHHIIPSRHSTCRSHTTTSTISFLRHAPRVQKESQANHIIFLLDTTSDLPRPLQGRRDATHTRSRPSPRFWSNDLDSACFPPRREGWVAIARRGQGPGCDGATDGREIVGVAHWRSGDV